MPLVIGSSGCTFYGTGFSLFKFSKVSKPLCSDLWFRVLVWGLGLGVTFIG